MMSTTSVKKFWTLVTDKLKLTQVYILQDCKDKGNIFWGSLSHM
jgi:hypothetical protein